MFQGKSQTVISPKLITVFFLLFFHFLKCQHNFWGNIKHEK